MNNSKRNKSIRQPERSEGYPRKLAHVMGVKMAEGRPSNAHTVRIVAGRILYPYQFMSPIDRDMKTYSTNTSRSISAR